MQCPLCKKNSMNRIELIPGLRGFTCNECLGVWLDRGEYDAWRVKKPRDLPEKSTPAHLAISETHKAKICPYCGHLLLPYRVGHGLAFSIDYCTACGGVWCERGEWDAILAMNLHDNLHDIITEHWQAAIRKEEVQKSIEQTYARHLGPSYEKALEVKKWLLEQPQKGIILAYLADQKSEVNALS